MTNTALTQAGQDRLRRRHVLFALGFRPFYLLAAGLAASWIPLWVMVWHGHFTIPSGFGPVGWHTHEMLFGFTSAVLVGFLLTAIPNWTGRPTATGLKLAGLAALWVAGRVVMLAGDAVPWQMAAAVDVAFLPVAAVTMLPPLVAARNRRNIAFPFVLLGLALANLVLHLDAGGVLLLGTEATRAVLGALLVILVIMGGRVIPFFTKNRLPAAGADRSERLDTLATAATVLAAVLSVLAPLTPASGITALASALLLVARALPWKPWETRDVPMLWVLHAGHAWIAVALFLRAALDLGLDLPASAPDHAFTIGGIGVLTLGMMARTARGHTGRAIEATRLMTAAFAIMNLAALVRVFGPIMAPGLPVPVIALSGMLWAVAFAFYLVEYVPILTGARVDGRPG
ncbi:NnrS family protein [Skermanella rosea]|uniref:NnrS family protein n=1 Tax=Skermanella rosea TaxID=1817965 RepID=UPI0019346939|nr:NnrS family protein [Skermanella rosea]UEM02422.1 NnrS family protein [Skermanella rosea]